MTSAVPVQGGEDFRIQLSDQIQYARFHMIHVRRGTEIKSVLFGPSLAKLLERLQYVRTVVRFGVVFADGNGLARYVE